MCKESELYEIVAYWRIVVGGETKEGQEVVGTLVESEPLCNVGVGLKRTINLGDYNSAQVSVSLHVPCKAKEIGKVFTFSKKWCEDRMGDLMGEAGASIGAD